MNRRITGVVGVAAALGLAATAMPGYAHAVTGIDGAPQKGAHQGKSDNLPDPLHEKRAATQQAAVNALMKGEAKLKGKGPNRVIQTQDGNQVSYPVSQTAQLLTFLVDFGDQDGSTDNASGPLHGELPKPSADDNSTYYPEDVSPEHYKEMFFGGLKDQNGESFKDAYKEMSSGRFDLEGDVSDWVTVPKAESAYQSATGDETAAGMTNYIQDTANAWYADQLAKGKTKEQIEDYLKGFDVWDRYDADGDGNYNEPDGYIDHFQAIHAGGGEEAGNPPWAIWSHRWSVNQGGVGTDGPASFPKLGGIKVGDSDLWIRDYTTEPEDGGLGVFAHEFGHDLGLPDFYDTVAGENSTAFWTLMSSGSWMSHGKDAIGTTPNHMGPSEKLFLGWVGPEDLAELDMTKNQSGKVTLGPSYHATTLGKQVLKVDLPDGEEFVDTGASNSGDGYLYSGAGDDRSATATSPTFTVPAGGELTAKVRYDLESEYDFTYVQVSTDGGANWTNLQTNKSRTDPLYHFGIDGSSDPTCDPNCENGNPATWTDLTADLSSYAGQDVKLRFRTDNDGGLHYFGFAVDDLAVGSALTSGFEPGTFSNWDLKLYSGIEGHGFMQPYEHYYLAESRQYQGYDKTLAEGPYNFGQSLTKPDTVEHFPYQDGLLVWYVNSLYGDNNTSQHEGYGQALPVDANPTALKWADGSVVRARIQAFDSTFGLQKTDKVTLHRETSAGAETLTIPSRPAVTTFDDTNVDNYWSSVAPLISTKVAGTGTLIKVLSQNSKTGVMQVEVGKKAPKATAAPRITGTPRVGSVLRAVPGKYDMSGVHTTETWYVGGRKIGTGASHKLVPSDAGKTVTVVETATMAGHLGSSTTSKPTAKVQPAAVAMSVKAPKKVKKGKKVTVTVTVASPAGTPGGYVRVTFAGKTVVKAVSGGHVTLKVPAKKKGKRTLTVTFLPSTGYAGATRAVTVKVK